MRVSYKGFCQKWRGEDRGGEKRGKKELEGKEGKGKGKEMEGSREQENIDAFLKDSTGPVL